MPEYLVARKSHAARKRELHQLAEVFYERDDPAPRPAISLSEGSANVDRLLVVKLGVLAESDLFRTRRDVDRELVVLGEVGEMPSVFCMIYLTSLFNLKRIISLCLSFSIFNSSLII